MIRPARECRLDFCDRPAYSSTGYCRAHSAQIRRGITPRPIKLLVRGRRCDFDGCDRRHKARGLCASHLNQQERGLALRPIRPRARRQPVAKGESPLPKGWLRTGAVKQTGRPPVDSSFGSLPVCPPTDPRTLAVVADRLRAWGADDLAEMVGVAPDQIRAEADRWVMWEGTAA
jgi:hypothetical protein